MSKILFENSNIEFIDGDRGKNYPKQEDFSDKGHCIFLSAKNVTSCGFNFDNKVFISLEKDNQLKAGKLKRNDIVITTRGTIGNIAIYDDKIPYNDVRINSGMLILRADSNKLDTKFLYYYLSSKEFKEQVNSLISGSAVPQLPIRDIKKLTLPNITKKQQEKIANIISSFEDRIELNTQINQTLEQIAQALFKSWFVDFDPVRAKVQALSDGLSLEQAELVAMQAISGKTPEELTALSQTQPDRYAELAETAKAFPCEMVEVSNSMYIPKGWKIKYFNEIIDTYIDNRGKTPPIEKQGIPLLEVKHLPKNSVFPDLNTIKYISNDTYENWLRNKPEALDIMLSTVGTVGRVNLVPINNKIAIAQNILGFRFNQKKATQIYMFYLMKSEKFIFDMEARVVETVQKSIKRKDLEKIPLLIPTLELQNLFSKFVIPFVIKQNNSENTNLEKIRNDLLPKLLSGEIQL